MKMAKTEEVTLLVLATFGVKTQIEQVVICVASLMVAKASTVGSSTVVLMGHFGIKCDCCKYSFSLLKYPDLALPLVHHFG
jgi:hypothetical protein